MSIEPDVNVRDVSDTDVVAAVLESPVPVLVDFWAEWCGPCRVLGPTVEQLASDYASRVSVAKVNVDDSPKTASTYGVRSVPTVMLFRDGRPVEASVGIRPGAQLAELIDRHID